MKKSLLLVVLVLGLVLTGCGSENNQSPSENGLEKVVIGASPSPHEEILESLIEDFKDQGLDVQIISFDDYVQPNLALADGDLDLNYFQHKPYLDEFCKDHNLELTSLGPVHIEAMALYSSKYTSLADLPDGAEILIPNDSSNGARALLLLAAEGIIELADPENIKATEEDIISNPKNLKFTALDAVNIARTYTDVDGGIINANYAIDVGLDPSKDSLLIEGKNSLYGNLLVARTGEENKEAYQKVLKVLHSDHARQIIEEKYKGNISPAF
ncbi:MAG: MetQ/NlpA family ABC transporter substrate-binding protein [Bacillota bacterium]|nr:MetQ/NlpA family ABC transporter substrate-binding protein [Bacillota bacterium]